MANRYADDIRRIVRFAEVKGGLDDASERAPIAGKRGIGFSGADGDSSGLSGIPGATLAPADTDGVLTSDGTNPFADSFTVSTGKSVSADDVLGGSLSVGDELRELRAEDCDTGDDLDLRTDGEIPPPGPVLADDGSLLSARWTSPDDPPVKVGAVLGVEWTNASNPTLSNSPGAAADVHKDAFNAISHLGGSDWFVSSLVSVTPGVSYLYRLASDTVGSEFLFGSGGLSCTPGSSSACPAEVAKETQFPEDNKTTLTLVNGKFIHSEFETETPTGVLDSPSIVDFCTAAGLFGRMEPTGDGGFMISERVSDGGALKDGAQYQVFNSDRRLLGSVNEESAATLRPKEVTAPVVITTA